MTMRPPTTLRCRSILGFGSSGGARFDTLTFYADSVSFALRVVLTTIRSLPGLLRTVCRTTRTPDDRYRLSNTDSRSSKTGEA